jgi:hypothetical protein
MKGGWWRSHMRYLLSVISVFLFLTPGSAWAVQRLSFSPGFNLYKTEQDVHLIRSFPF